jgi:plastocyanin
MDNDFRRRALLPFLLPLGLLLGIGLFVFSISRVLLAVPEMVSTMTALLLAGYVLLIAFLVQARRRITGRALGGGLVIGMVAVLAAGVVAGAAGMRDLHADEAHDDEPDGVATEAAIPADAFVFVAIDLEFTEAPTSIPAGQVTLAIDNRGNLPHNVVIEGVGGGSPVVEADGGQVDVATITLEPGTYSYICDIPGHAATMFGEFEVTG